MTRKIDSIVVHCSDSPDYLDIGAKEINEWHIQRGWREIGYHYVIRRNGEIEKGRPEEVSGAHAKGANGRSLGIVWVGRNSISPEQNKSLIGLINWLRGKYNIEIDNVKGHCEAVETDKTCPNINMNRLRAELVFIQPKPEVR